MRKNKVKVTNQFSILTLDDDPIMTSTIQAYFQRSGYRVDVENDPYKAIERVRDGNYDILLLDFLMTPICGDQVVEEIRKFNRELFIVLLTGHKSMAPPIQTIRQLDIQGYYEKSDRFDQLELLVESCIKSIRQMRTIKNYQRGLAAVVDSLPQMYHLQSADKISREILSMTEEIVSSKSAFLAYYEQEWGKGQFYLEIDQEEGKETAEGLLKAVGPEDTEVMRKEGFLLVPVINDFHKVMGILGIETEKEPEYEQIQLLKVYTRQISAAISNARLHEKLSQAYQSLKAGYMETITTLRYVVEARDAETRGHSDRVSGLAADLARQMGMDGETVEQIRIAGLFHDIGKIGVPDQVLLKPSRLTDEEYMEIKKHPAAGARILSGMTLFTDLVPMIRSHHERVDGKGYPDGLKGDRIPLGARAISVADSFDAMMSNRQYRKGLGLQKTIEEMEAGRGTQFDCSVVDAFFSLLKQLGEEEFVRRYCPQAGKTAV